MDEQVQDYINKMRTAGKRDAEIKQELRNTGWKDEMFNEYFSKKQEPYLGDHSEQAAKPNKIIFIIIGSIIILGVGAFIVFAQTGLFSDNTTEEVQQMNSDKGEVVDKEKQNKNTKEIVNSVGQVINNQNNNFLNELEFSINRENGGAGSCILAEDYTISDFEIWEKCIDYCDEELFGSLIDVIDTRDSHIPGENFINFEVDVRAKKDLTIKLENRAGINYSEPSFGTQVFRARFKNDLPWSDEFRFNDSALKYYVQDIPEGESTLFFTLDSEWGYIDAVGYHNSEWAVIGLSLDGPYSVNLDSRVESEESFCVFEIGEQQNGYNPPIKLLPEGVITDNYLWKDFE